MTLKHLCHFNTAQKVYYDECRQKDSFKVAAGPAEWHGTDLHRIVLPDLFAARCSNLNFSVTRKIVSLSLPYSMYHIIEHEQNLSDQWRVCLSLSGNALS